MKRILNTDRKTLHFRRNIQIFYNVLVYIGGKTELEEILAEVNCKDPQRNR